MFGWFILEIALSSFTELIEFILENTWSTRSFEAWHMFIFRNIPVKIQLETHRSFGFQKFCNSVVSPHPANPMSRLQRNEQFFKAGYDADGSATKVRKAYQRCAETGTLNLSNQKLCLWFGMKFLRLYWVGVGDMGKCRAGWFLANFGSFEQLEVEDYDCRFRYTQEIQHGHFISTMVKTSISHFRLPSFQFIQSKDLKHFQCCWNMAQFETSTFRIFSLSGWFHMGTGQGLIFTSAAIKFFMGDLLWSGS